MRRSGKSTLLLLLKEELIKRGVSTDHIVYLNFESLEYARIDGYLALYKHVKEKKEHVQNRLYILLDEIQNIPQWEKAINSFRVDFDCDMYITGSNAHLLAGELATYIAGRYIEICVYPLSFSEYLEFKHHTSGNDASPNIDKNAAFAEFLRYGGLPGQHQLNWNHYVVDQYLKDIYSSILLKDVIAKNNIRDIVLLEQVVAYIFDNIGNIFSAKRLADFLKNQGRKLSTETVYNYIKALQAAFMVYKVPRYDIKGKQLLETQEKYFIGDLGIRHAVLGYRDADISGLLENTVYLELLRRGYKVTIGKHNTNEVDFVATNEGEKLYIQVCYVLHSENIEREFSPLEAIDDNYEKIVLSTDTLLGTNRNGIKQKNIIDFLLETQMS